MGSGINSSCGGVTDEEVEKPYESLLHLSTVASRFKCRQKIYDGARVNLIEWIVMHLHLHQFCSFDNFHFDTFVLLLVEVNWKRL